MDNYLQGIFKLIVKKTFITITLLNESITHAMNIIELFTFSLVKKDAQFVAKVHIVVH